PLLDDLRDRFGLLDQRPDWRPSRQEFRGTGLAYTLTGEGGLWAKAPFAPPKYDPLADLALEASERDAGDDRSRRAAVLVLLLPAAEGDAVKLAREHLLKRQKEDYPRTTVADLGSQPGP